MRIRVFTTHTLVYSLNGNEVQYINMRLSSDRLYKLLQIVLQHATLNYTHTESYNLLLKKYKALSLSVALNQLYNEVLRLLVQYHTQSTENIKAQQDLLKADMLRRKSMIHQYELTLQRQLKDAEAKGQLTLACDIATRLLNTAGLLVKPDSLKLVLEYSNTLQRLAYAQQVIASLKALYYNLYRMTASNRYAIDSADLQLIKQYKKQVANAEQYTKQYSEVDFYYHGVQVMICSFDLAPEKLQQNANKVQLAIKKLNYDAQHLCEYLSIMNIYLGSRFTERDFGTVKEELQKISILKSSDPIVKATKFAVLMSNRIRYEATTFNYQSVAKSVAFVYKEYQQYQQYFNIDMCTTLYINSLIVNYILQQYDMCTYWHSKLLTIGKRHIRKDAYSFLRIFLFVVYISSDNFEALEKQYRKVKREITLEKNTFQFDIAFCDAVKKLLDGHSAKKTIIALGDSLVPLLAHNYQSLPLRYFNFIGWCKSVEKGVSYMNYNLRRTK